MVEEVGNHEDDSNVEQKRKSKDILLPADKALPPTEIRTKISPTSQLVRLPA